MCGGLGDGPPEEDDTIPKEVEELEIIHLLHEATGCEEPMVPRKCLFLHAMHHMQ